MLIRLWLQILVFTPPWAPDAWEPVFVLGTILISLAILVLFERWWNH